MPWSITCFHSPLPLSLFKIVCKRWLFIIQHERVVWEHRPVTVNEQPERFKQMLCSFTKNDFFVQQLDISGVLMNKFVALTQQVTKSGVLNMVLRHLREHFNQTLHSHHLIFRVCCFVQTSFTQGS